MKSNERILYCIGALVLAAGLVLMAVGIQQGEMIVVMQKAIQICMECIGIG